MDQKKLPFEKNREEKILKKLQDKLLLTKDISSKNKVITKIYKIGFIYSKKIVKKILSKDGTSLSDNVVNEKSIDTITKFIEHYYVDPNFKVNISFGKLLKFKAQEVLHGYKIKREDKKSSLNQLIEESKNEKSDLIFNQLHESEKEKLILKEDFIHEDLLFQELFYEAIKYYYDRLRKIGKFYEASLFLSFIQFSLNKTHYKTKKKLYDYVPYLSKQFGENCILTLFEIINNKDFDFPDQSNIDFYMWKIQVKKEIKNKHECLSSEIRSLNKLLVHNDDLVKIFKITFPDIKFYNNKDKEDFIVKEMRIIK